MVGLPAVAGRRYVVGIRRDAAAAKGARALASEGGPKASRPEEVQGGAA